MRRFRAPYDRTTIVVSALVAAFLFAIPIAVRMPLLAGIAVLLLILGYAWSPRSYTVSGALLIVHRLIGAYRVPLDNLRGVRKLDPGEESGWARLWGSGGLFGYYGLFWTRSLGTCRWFVTDRSKSVILFGSGKPILVSPDDPDAFLAMMPAGSEVASPGPLDGTIQSLGPRNTIGMAIAGIIVVAVLAFLAYVFSYSPGPPALTITAQSLTVHDRFYPVTIPADSVDVGAIRTIDLAHDPEWRPVMRVGGFSNSHYHSGWFRAANGQRMRMYRANSNRLVLFPPQPGNPPLLVESPNPDELVAEVRREWKSR